MIEFLVAVYLIVGLLACWACASDDMIEIICIGLLWLPIFILVLISKIIEDRR